MDDDNLLTEEDINDGPDFDNLLLKDNVDDNYRLSVVEVKVSQNTNISNPDHNVNNIV